MTPKKLKIRQEEKTAAGDYPKKAEDNLKAMIAALKDGNFNAAGTLAVQCAISYADAICVYEKGVRSISQDHFDVCDLVSSLPLEEAKEKSKLLRKIVSKKNLVQYERRNIYKDEALEMVKITTRFYQWVKSYLIENHKI